jgi:hypothetical protein
MNVYQITQEQKDLLNGQKWNNEAFFNPTQDADGNWFISKEEVEGYSAGEFTWISELQLIPYNPIISDLFM